MEHLTASGYYQIMDQKITDVTVLAFNAENNSLRILLVLESAGDAAGAAANPQEAESVEEKLRTRLTIESNSL